MNHINGKKYFNWVGNLEWNTAKENSDHAWRTNLVNNRGENQGHSIYTNNQIECVCKLLQEGKKNANEISEITGVSYKTIYEIHVGRKWAFISRKYKFPEFIPSQKKHYTYDQIVDTCKLLEDPKISHKEISAKTGVSINTIKDIMKKTVYKNISDKFNIVTRINSAQYSPNSKYTEDQISKVCELLATTNIPISDISSKTNVGISTVYDVLSGSKWKLISSNYNFDNRKNKVKSSTTILKME